jgi:hypothetical protein
MRHRFFAFAIVGLLIVTIAAVHAEDWPQFRGARAGVATDDAALPDTWSSTESVVWKIDVPGRSWSSPIVWGDHVFVTTAINTAGDAPLRPTAEYVGRSVGGTMTAQDLEKATTPLRWVIYDIDFKTGKVRWEREVGRGVPPQPRHQKNSYAAETPVADGERVYAYIGNVGIFAFDMSGKPVWSKPLPPVKVRQGLGSAASPVLYKDRLYIVNDNDEQSYIAAFDKMTGAEIWRVERKEGSNWATPFIWENERRTEIITAGTGRIRSYDLDGKLLWELAGMSIYTIPTPFAVNGLLYIASGYPGDQLRPTYAIRPGATGDITLKPDQTTNDYIAWSHPTLGPYNPSTLVYGGCYYTLIDRGLLTCNDPKTGKEIYPRQRISMDATSFTASPWAYNSQVFLLSEDGDTYVIQAGPEFKLLRKNSLNEMTLASPAIANGSIIFRTASKLYRIARQK